MYEGVFALKESGSSKVFYSARISDKHCKRRDTTDHAVDPVVPRTSTIVESFFGLRFKPHRIFLRDTRNGNREMWPAVRGTNTSEFTRIKLNFNASRDSHWNSIEFLSLFFTLSCPRGFPISLHRRLNTSLTLFHHLITHSGYFGHSKLSSYGISKFFFSSFFSKGTIFYLDPRSAR